MAGQSVGSTGQASFLPVVADASPQSLGGLIGLALRRPGGRRSVSLFTVLLLVAGIGMFAFPALTDLWGTYQQRQVKDELSSPSFQTQYLEHRVKVGEGLTRLIINNDRVHVNVMVVEGTTLAALQAGAGHYESTPFPCEPARSGSLSTAAAKMIGVASRNAKRAASLCERPTSSPPPIAAPEREKPGMSAID